MGFTFRRFSRWVAVFFAVVLAATLVWHWMGTRAYHRELAAWQAAGGLVSIREADTGPIPAEVNAATFWLKAYAALPPQSRRQPVSRRARERDRRARVGDT